MTVWLLAATGIMPVFALAVCWAGRGNVEARLVAVQLAGSLACIMLAVMTFAFDQSSFMDVALTLSLLTFPGMAAIAIFLERWL